MGNVFHGGPQAKILEFRLSPLQFDTPGRDPPFTVFAKLAPLNARDRARDAPWDEAVAVQLPDCQGAVLISLHARRGDSEARVLTEFCVPYSGEGGLVDLGISPGGPPIPLRLALTNGMRIENQSPEELIDIFLQAREGVGTDKPCLALSVREVPLPDQEPTVEETDWTMPPARRQVIFLEMQNAALQHQKHKLLDPEGPEAPGEENAEPTYVRQLHMIQEENEKIREETDRIRQKLDETRAIEAHSSARQKGAHDWSKTLRGLQEELTHCRQRQKKIQDNYEERVRGLQGQLQRNRQNQSAVDMTFNPHAQDDHQLTDMLAEVTAMDGRIEEASARREELMSRWDIIANAREREASQEGVGGDCDLERLQASKMENEATIERLHIELGEMQKGQASEHRQQLERRIAQLYEELDELQRVREDQRVRSESEVRELKANRDKIKDGLDEATAEVHRLRSQSEALNAMRARADGNARPSMDDLNQLRYENDLRAQELQRLRECEETRKQAIIKLEREQDGLVQQMTLKAAQSVPLAEGNHSSEYAKELAKKSDELSQLLARAQSSVEEKQRQVAHVKQSALELQADNERLRSSYQSQFLNAEQDLLRSPLGTSEVLRSPGPPGTAEVLRS